MIRDWGSSYEYPYGKDGGNRYIKKQLEVDFIYHESINYVYIYTVIVTMYYSEESKYSL